MTNYKDYLDAEYRLNEGLIRTDISETRPEGYVKTPLDRMQTMATFLKQCGNPQAGIPAIHVAGTSGKGSVCAAIAGALKAAGLKVGLHISPYLQSATEKIWIDGKYISASCFAELIDWIMPIALPFKHSQTPASIHGMASVAIAFEAFRREKVDMMVFETGCGGRYDLTSFVDTQVAVITNIGLDHLLSLGPGIEDIAWHKAGIIRKNIPVITGATGIALDVIRREAQSLDAPLTCIPPNASSREHNHQLARKAVNEFAGKAGLPLSSLDFEAGLSSVRLPGRFEHISNSPTVFLDGAHNADKLTAAIQHALSNHHMGPRVALVGFLGTKANHQTIAPILGKFDHIIATEPNVYGKAAFPAAETARLFEGESSAPLVCCDPLQAVQMALELTQNGTLLICGSFYLCGEIRNYWYSKEAVVLQQTSWPD
ncbi:MAG: hypothetical protein JXX14_08175 [Deltaproteobacteria bacterium]|nr:hypothetical protein [Deltaproteobacteria bacterium]